MKTQGPSLSHPFLDLQQNPLFSFISQSTIETTSIDGRPLLTPDQFKSLLFSEIYSKMLHTAAQREMVQYQKLIQTKNNLNLKTHLLKDKRSSGTETITIRDSDDEFTKPSKQRKCAEGFVVKVEPMEESHHSVIGATTSSSKGSFKPKIQMPKESNTKKIVGLQYDQNEKDLVFNIDPSTSGESSKIKRKELLEKDPLSLMYFYESQLKFTKELGVDPRELKKL